jgi:hypothetical protein
MSDVQDTWSRHRTTELQRYQFVSRGTIWKTSNGVQRSNLRRWVIGKVPDG